jgi:arylsulfatase
MLARHEMWKKEYPDKPKARGVAFTGIDNARPETKAIEENFVKLQKELPFDPLKFITDFEMPEELRVSQRTNGVD